MKARRILAAALLAASLSLVAASAAHADPAFGPGNGQQNGTPVCHPPGQTSDLPQCK